MKIFALLFLFHAPSLYAENKTCDLHSPSSGLTMQTESLRTLGKALAACELISTENQYAKISNSEGAETELKSGCSINAGDQIVTGPGQEVVLRFFNPRESRLTIHQNSSVLITGLPTQQCGVNILLQQGKVTAEAEHNSPQVQNCSPEITTENVEVKPVGTKYSVDLTEALAESSGEPIQVENYAVEKGSIQIKLKKLIVSKKSRRIAKNGSFKLKAGRKAKLSKNKKTQVADIEVVEP